VDKNEKVLLGLRNTNGGASTMGCPPSLGRAGETLEMQRSEEHAPQICFAMAKWTQRGEDTDLHRNLHPGSCFNT